MPIRAALILALAISVQGQQIAPSAQRQIAALLSEKASRTPAQRKMSAHLVHASKILRGQPVHPDFPTPPGALAAVRLNAQNAVEVDVRGEITPALLEYIGTLGGTVVSSFPEYHSLRATLPLLAVEQLAARQEVVQVQSSEPGYVHQLPVRSLQPVADRSNRRRTAAAQFERFFGARSRNKRGFGKPFRSSRAAFFVGPDFSGDVAHQANVARAISGFDGTGVKVGVLSNGVDSLPLEQAAGRVPAVQVISGQAGSGDEGTAMLEIVYSLAPGATLYFATSHGGQALMANNIQALADAGCKIIVDDTYYTNEPIFQDGIIAQKVNAVSAVGVFYFSSAGNEGNLLNHTSGVWEGDFASATFHDQVDALPPGTDLNLFPPNGSIGRILVPSPLGLYTLTWSDPLGRSTNDYDLFILDNTRTNVVAYSTDVQDGAQDPEEHITDSNHLVVPNDEIVIVRNSGAAIRALHLEIWSGQLFPETNGSTSGHNATSGAFTIGAVDVHSAAGGTFTSGTANPVEPFSSDGPRRVFFRPDGTEITSGNVLFGNATSQGGMSLKKPDFTAADGVMTGLAMFAPFYGTSAAAPHAAAIAALVLQARPAINADGMRAFLSASALGPGSPNFGAGIIMASRAVAAITLNCTYSISPGGEAFPADGGAGTININTQPSCPWTISTQPPWVSVTGTLSEAGSSPNGTGVGVVNYQVLYNRDLLTGDFGPDRSAELLIGDQAFTIEQQAYEPVSGPNLSFIGAMPHIAAEENWTTTFTFINKGSTAAQARFSLFNDNGNPLLLPLVFPQQPPVAGPLLGASLDRTIAPNASLVITTAGPTTSPVQVGSAQLDAIGTADGFAIFHLIPGAQEAVVPLETRHAASYLLAYDNTAGVVLGVAIDNADLAESVQIPVVIRDDTGAQIGNDVVTLNPLGHTSFVLSQRYPITANARGTIEFGGGLVSVLGIRTTPLGTSTTLTTIPPLANVGTNGGSIAHVPVGDGWKTTFVLVNTGTGPGQAQAHLKFYDDNGNPLLLPLSFPQAGGGSSAGSSVDRTLAAGAMLLIESTGSLTDPLRVGSAQLTTDGNVGGFVIFRYQPNGQEAVVPLESRSAGAYLLAFDNTNGTATGIALNSASSQAVNVPVVIRDDTGLQIASDTISLAANGRIAFTLGTDKYPATANIRGTIEFDTPAGAQIGALGIRIPSAHTFTTLPALAQ